MALPMITATGTMVADPELRFTPQGKAVAGFRIACNSRRYNKDTGQWEDGDATFLSCNLWGKPGENLAQSASKGTLVTVVGKLRQRTYETNEGEKRTVFEVDVDEVGVSVRYATADLKKNQRSGGGQGAAGPSSDPWTGGSPTGGFGQPQDDGEPPF